MRTITLLTLATFFLLALNLRGEEPRGLADFKKHRGLLEKRLNHLDVADRIAALGELKQYPLVDAIKFTLPYWMKDPSPEVRAAAVDALFAFKDEGPLRVAMLDMLKKEVTEVNAILVAVWLAGTPADDQRELLEPLGKLLDKRPLVLQTLYVVADQLGSRHDAATVKALTGLSKLAAFKNQFGFRRCVVMALTGVRHADAITRLLETLPEADGETRGDIIQYLTRVSGQAFGNDAGAWQTWWTTKQENFAFPNVLPNGQVMLKQGQVTYYGIPIYAKKVIFVIDTSGSMAGSRITHARAELIKTVDNLPTGTDFNIVGYNSALSAWNRNLVTSSTDNKSKATRWVKQQQAVGATHTYDALKVTMDQQPEAVYLLTDGQPTGGTLVDPRDILEAIKQTNRYRRTTIHVIGVNPGPEDGVFSKFLKTLAAQNWGQYRRVD